MTTPEIDGHKIGLSHQCVYDTARAKLDGFGPKEKLKFKTLESVSRAVGKEYPKANKTLVFLAVGEAVAGVKKEINL